MLLCTWLARPSLLLKHEPGGAAGRASHSPAAGTTSGRRAVYTPV